MPDPIAAIAAPLYTQRYNRHHQRDGSLFRGRYKAFLVDQDEYLAQVVRYIHLNPVSAGLVSQPEQYRWSSHRHYLQSRGAPQWLNTSEASEQVGGRQAFHEFVLSGNEEALEMHYASKRQSPILGGDGFIAKETIPKAAMEREIPQYHRRAVQIDPRRVIGKVAGVYGIAEADVLRGIRGKENEARKVAMYLVTRCCERTLSEAASLFGLSSYGAVGWSCHGVKAKMEREKSFRGQIERIAAEINQQKI